jgi:hypothetical protein
MGVITQGGDSDSYLLTYLLISYLLTSFSFFLDTSYEISVYLEIFPYLLKVRFRIKH